MDHCAVPSPLLLRVPLLLIWPQDWYVLLFIVCVYLSE